MAPEMIMRIEAILRGWREEIERDGQSAESSADVARRVLEWMREPTPEILEVLDGFSIHIDSESNGYEWRAMIDAALKGAQ